MNFVDRIALKSIKTYRKINKISPWGKQASICRFYPSCSEYTYQAISRYGTIKGLFLGIKRIVRCNPFSKGGMDLLK